VVVKQSWSYQAQPENATQARAEIKHPAMIPRSEPALLASFRNEGDEAPWPEVFSHLGARRRTLLYVEHSKVRKHAWVGYIVGRSRQLVRSAG